MYKVTELNSLKRTFHQLNWTMNRLILLSMLHWFDVDEILHHQYDVDKINLTHSRSV